MIAFRVTLTIRIGRERSEHEALSWSHDQRQAIRQVVRDWILRGKGRLTHARAVPV